MLIPGPLDYSGLAWLEDFSSERWRSLFAELEAVQREFLGRADAILGAEYRLPREPLYKWSRCWEYPYALHHLRSSFPASARAGRVVIDYGSGVTFFPFAVAREGFAVAAVDIDPVCAEGFARARAELSTAPGRVDFFQSSAGEIGLPDGGAAAAYCVSVLEHVDDFERAAAELARTLAPGGPLVLTVDLDLNGAHDLSPARHRDLMRALAKHFELGRPLAAIHPLSALTTATGPYPVAPAAKRLKAGAKNLARKALGRPVPRPYRLACEGLVLERKR